MQGLQGMAVPLTGVDKGSSRMHQERQREIADACRQEVAVAEGSNLQRSTLIPEGRMHTATLALQVCFALGWKKPKHWKNGNLSFPLLQKQNLL